MEQLNFGFAGQLDIRVLDQDEVWRDATGFTHQIKDMSNEYLKNIVPFLIRHGDLLRFRWSLSQYGPSDDGGNLDAAFDEWLEDQMTQPFEEWLFNRPLVKCIHSLTRIRSLPHITIAKRPEKRVTDEAGPEATWPPSRDHTLFSSGDCPQNYWEPGLGPCVCRGRVHTK